MHGCRGIYQRNGLLLAVLIVSIVTLAPARSLGQEATPAIPAAGPDCRDVWRDDLQAKTLTLLADCVTHEPITFPNGWTLEGAGHKIFAADPFDSDFGDGIVTVSRRRGVVRDLTIDGTGLAAPCGWGGRKALVGLMYINGTGEVSGVTVQNLNWPPEPDEAAPKTQEPCGTGIAVLGRSAGALIERTVVRNAGAGGILVEDGIASVSNTTINHADTGIVATHGGRARIAPGNRISNGATGIRFSGSDSSGRIAGNTIESMSHAGIAIGFGAQASIADNILTDTGEHGILVERSETEATLENNQIAGPDVGITVVEGAAADLSANRVANAARNGIHLWRGASATLRGNRVSDAAESGILIENATTATIGDGNDIRGGQWGISLFGAGTTVTILENMVYGTAHIGIVVQDGAAATIDGNALSSAGSGIYLRDDGSHAVITGNMVTATNYGIEMFGGATAEVTGNTFDGPGLAGIQLGPDATVEVTGNRIVRSGEAPLAHDGPYGISILEDVSGTITGNEIAGFVNSDLAYVACGILVAPVPELLIADNDFPAPGNEVDVCDPSAATPAATPLP